MLKAEGLCFPSQAQTLQALMILPHTLKNLEIVCIGIILMTPDNSVICRVPLINGLLSVKTKREVFAVTKKNHPSAEAKS